MRQFRAFVCTAVYITAINLGPLSLFTFSSTNDFQSECYFSKLFCLLYFQRVVVQLEFIQNYSVQWLNFNGNFNYRCFFCPNHSAARWNDTKGKRHRFRRAYRLFCWLPQTKKKNYWNPMLLSHLSLVYRMFFFHCSTNTRLYSCRIIIKKTIENYAWKKYLLIVLRPVK